MFAFRSPSVLSSPSGAALAMHASAIAAPGRGGAVLTQRRAGGFWFGRQPQNLTPAVTRVAVAEATPASDWDSLDPDQRVRLLGEW